MKFSDLPLHHALLLTHDDRARYGEMLWEELRVISPAHKYFNQTVLDIETARSLISFVHSPYSGEKVALVSFHTATLPAQNALLKVLEEPRGSMRFILLTTNKEHLIPTILSRTQHVKLVGESGDRYKLMAQEFLETSPAYRMKLTHVTDILASLDEEGRKDRERVKAFILALVPFLVVNKVSLKYVIETIEIASYASDPSASGKVLLEYLSLLLPVIK